MIRYIVATCGLVTLIAGCSNQPNETLLKQSKPHSIYVLCPDTDGFKLRESCESTRLTPIAINRQGMKSESIAPITYVAESTTQVTQSESLSYSVFFSDNKYIPNNKQQNKLKKWLKNNPSLKQAKVNITAHTSSNGSLEHNAMLAEARLLSIKSILSQYGIKQVTSLTSPQCCRTGESEALMSLDRKVVLSIQ